MLTFACVKRDERYYMVKAKLLIGKKDEQSFSFIVSLQSGKKTSPFKFSVKSIPVTIPEINEYIQEAIEITFDAKSRKIANAMFSKNVKALKHSLEF